jgi:hypothetical protein
VHSLYNSGSISTVGSMPEFTEIRSIAVAQGRFYHHEDNSEARNVAFLGSDTKKQLFSDHEAVGQQVWMNEIPYSVIGVMKSKDQNSSYDGMDTRKIFIPYNTMRRDFPTKAPGVEHTIDRLLVAPKSLETHPDCLRQIRRSLGRLHNFDPRDKEAAGIWDTVKNAEANRMIIVGMEFRAGTYARNWRAHGVGRNAQINTAPIFYGNSNRGGAERRNRAAGFVWILCASEPAAHAAVFRRPARKLEAWSSLRDLVGLDFRFVGAVSRESRGICRSHRSAAF